MDSNTIILLDIVHLDTSVLPESVRLIFSAPKQEALII